MPPLPGILIILCGPSGVGKSTISRRLVEELGLCYTVSATTRPRKPGDEKGKTYDHISREEFLRRLDADEFLEYAVVYDEYYGTPKRPAGDQLAAGRDVLMEIDVQGALQVRSLYPQALTVFILPPDEGTLLKRLTDRARDSEEQIAKRNRAARREIRMARGSRAFDHMIVNDDLDRAVAQVVDVIQRRRAEAAGASTPQPTGTQAR